MSGKLWRSWELLCSLAWPGALLLLPVTSSPLIVRLTHASTVAPPSAFIFLVLALLWLMPYVFRHGRLPLETSPLLWLAGAVLVSWAFSFFVTLPSMRQRSQLTEAKEAFATFVIALAVFMVTAAWLSQNRGRLRQACQWLNLGGFLLIAWCLVQAEYALFHNSQYPLRMLQFQWWFSNRGNDPLVYARVTGFAYEPSWLAHQLNLVYLPFWLAATLFRQSAHSRRLWKISVENLLLAAGLVVLYLSRSRIGWLSFSLVVVVVAVALNWRLARRMQDWLLRRWPVRSGRQPVNRGLVTAGLLVVFLSVYLAALVGLGALASRSDKRLASIFKGEWLRAGGFYEAVNKLMFAERIVYWNAGWDIFTQHPILGVGLGNAGFYFTEDMPAYGWGLPEISNTFNRWPGLPNIKSLWVRLLAETGLVGFAIFAGWLFLLAQSGRLALRSSDRWLQTLAAAGLFALIAFVGEGFSIDSFALPYLWFAAGLLTATAFHARHPI